MYSINKKALFCIIACAFIFFSCTTKRSVRFSKNRISANSNIAVVIDCPNNIKNVVLSEFMKRKFRVMAFNASDFYTLNDVYDIKDFRKVSYKSSLRDIQALMSMEKTYDNLYKLHVYNYEVNKAEILQEMREKWKIDYLIIFDLKDWESISWGRAIRLDTYEVVWVENYPTKFTDNVQTIVSYFIRSIMKG